MKLLLKENCSACGACLKACPNGLKSISSLNCMQCSPEKAACIKACARNAICFHEGVVAINALKCNGCMECVKACKHNAIEPLNGKAAKCDLCMQNGFDLKCIAACREKALALASTKQELEEVAETLGWVCKSPRKNGRVVRKGKNFELFELENGKKLYSLNCFPELSAQEALLLNQALEEFKQRSGTGKRELESALERCCRKALIELEAEQKQYLLRYLEASAFGFGAISELLRDDCLEEISLNCVGEKNPVRVYDKSNGWVETNLHYCSESDVRELANKMSRTIGRRLTFQSPLLNAVLPDGNRLSACIKPASFLGPSICIRKFRSKPFTPQELAANNTFSPKALAFLWTAMQVDLSLVLAGNTGSGKTTSMNALFCFVPREERIIIVEETPEINLPHRHVVKMNVVKELGISMEELVTQSLRMRPDRIIVGEIREKPEVQAFMDTLLAGQGKGSYATFHAQSAEEALMRFRNLGVMELDISAIDLIVVQKRWNKIELDKGKSRELRRVTEIVEPCGKNGKLELRMLFSYDYKKDFLESSLKSARVFEKMLNSFSLSEKELREELLKRAAIIERAEKSGMDFLQSLEYFNSCTVKR